MAVASQCLTPRAKFMKVMFYNLLATCTCAAMCCLGVVSAVKAREHTTRPGGSLDEYNSSASAVSAVWLLFAIWFVSHLFQHTSDRLILLGFQILSVRTSHRSSKIPWLLSQFFPASCLHMLLNSRAFQVVYRF